MFLSRNAVHSVLKDGMNAILILNVSKSKCSSFRFNMNIRVNTLNNGMNGSFDFRAPPSGELLNLKMLRAQETLTVFMPFYHLFTNAGPKPMINLTTVS